MDRLREAIKHFLVASSLIRSDQPNTPYVKVMGPSVDDVEIVLAAARRFLALTETGQEYRDIDYCLEHFESAWSPDECWKQVYGEDDHYVPWDSPCRIVRVQLIPADYLTEDP